MGTQDSLKYRDINQERTMDHQDALSFRTRSEWRRWLSANHDKVNDVWVIHFKKDSGHKGLDRADAVEDAICYGWIDGKLRSLDGEKYVLRYSPRRKGSVWSQINKRIALNMIRKGRMTPPGLQKVEEAKRNGMWAAAYSSRNVPPAPEDLKKALARNQTTQRDFDLLPASRQTQYVYWVITAKKGETRKKRIEDVLKMVCKSEKTRNSRQP